MSSPLIDLALAEQLFAVVDEREIPELRALLAEFSADVPRRFRQLRARCEDGSDKNGSAQAVLHGLRGVVGNFALSRAAQTLQQLETAWPGLSPAQRGTALEAAESEVTLGMRLLREQFSYLEN